MMRLTNKIQINSKNMLIRGFICSFGSVLSGFSFLFVEKVSKRFTNQWVALS